MLEEVKLTNFKNHRSTQLNFAGSRLQALVGQNGAGKTSVLEALYYLSKLASSSSASLPKLPITVGQKNISITASGNLLGFTTQRHWQAFYRCRQQDSDSSWIPTEVWRVEQEQERESLKTADYLKHWIYLKLVASNLAKAAYSDETTPQVKSDGSGLAPALDYLRSEAPEKFQELEELLKQIVPGVRGLNVRRAKVGVSRQRSIEIDGKPIFYEEDQQLIGQEVVLNMNTGEQIPAQAVSEGTMLTLGLLAAIMHPKQPNLILLDDVEQGLHPKAQRELMTVLKEIIASNENLQIIFSTHSSYIVDELTPSQVYVLNNANSGFTVAKRLDEHPDIEWAKQALTTGEFWDAEDEDWVAGVK